MQGRLSAWLAKHGLVHRSLGFDYQGIETLQIKPEDWHSIAVILYVYGCNYLCSQYAYGCNYLCSQYAYDVAPDELLASVYHLTRITYGIDQPEEVCIKVFALRLIRHEWDASFFDVGASLKNCSRRLQRIKPCGSFGPQVDKLLVGLEQVLPHKKHVWLVEI